MSRGDVYMVSLNPAHGHEQRGRRPVLVISPTAFNQAAKLPVILPITSGGEFACRVGFAVPLTRVKTKGVVRCDQPRPSIYALVAAKEWSPSPRNCL